MSSAIPAAGGICSNLCCNLLLFQICSEEVVVPSSSSSLSMANALHVVPIATCLLSLVDDFTSCLGDMLSESDTFLPLAFPLPSCKCDALVIFVRCFEKHLFFYP
jgi:hypothetical protein